jgi:transcription antitermination factor NusG
MVVRGPLQPLTISRSRTATKKIIDLNYRLFTYEHQRPRRRPTIRSWLPGYFFIEFDMHDEWYQLNRVPGVIEILQRPLEAELIDDLVERLPKRVSAIVTEWKAFLVALRCELRLAHSRGTQLRLLGLSVSA